MFTPGAKQPRGDNLRSHTQGLGQRPPTATFTLDNLFYRGYKESYRITQHSDDNGKYQDMHDREKTGAAYRKI